VCSSDLLTAVLADIDARNIKQVICLGDVIGYGPEPRECMDLVISRSQTTLLGNHDYAVLFEPNKFNIGAESACYWTRQQLDDEKDAALRAKRLDFMGSQIIKHVMDGKSWNVGEMVFVHASPRRPVNEYIFPDDVYSNPARIASCFDRFSHVCFVGHTHVPGVFLETPDFYSPDEVSGVWEFSGPRKVLINVGSVGQPRDRDPRASYVVVEPGLARFVRVEYDVESVVQKVLAVPELDNYLGTRLRDGR
jgi:diadenosine tetraphosphatase ApaH/serine/threonine PP2A family protein phosphatase